MRIKLELKQVLSEANEMGKMKEILKQMLGLYMVEIVSKLFPNYTVSTGGRDR